MSLRCLLAASVSALVIVPVSARAAADPVGQDDIVVTAEKTHRSLRDTASSVVVLTDEDMERRAGLYSVDDILSRIPNLVTVEPSNSAPAVRGVDGTGPASGVDAFFAGTRPRLNYQVDGRTLSFNEAVFGNASLWDVAQVEVYRGPQSTLQGRNAVAGVVALKTNDPSFAWHGAARAIIGDRDERQLSAALGGPIISDVAAFRLSADWRQERNYLSFTPYPQAADPGRADTKTFRGKLLLTPGAGIRSLWTLSYLDGRTPQAAYVKRPFHEHRASSPMMPVFRSRVGTAISDTSIALSDVVTVQALLSAADFRVDRYAPVRTGNVRIDGKEYAFQPFVRLTAPDGRFSGFLAAYIFRTHQNEAIDVFGGGTYRDETQTDALFGEATFKPIDRLSLILGARYETEHRYRTGRSGPFVTQFDETYRVFLPKATVSLTATPDVTVGVTAGRGYNAGGAGLTFSPPIVTYTYRPEFVWNYEGFLRATVTRGLTVTGNVFYNDYRDIQLPYYLSALSTAIRNAQKATTYGAEAGLEWKPTQKDRVFASIGLLKTKVDRYDGQASQGNDLPRAPAFSAATGFVLSPDGRFEMGADVRYSDAYYSDVLNNARGKTRPYALVNAQIAYPIGAVRLFFSVRNLLDTDTPLMIVTGASKAADYAILQAPRKVTGGIAFQF
ncbi:TonB-dependent receptor [Sphingomonas sp.]|uniref:TonB-dependent receptor n=1 Tax=Sphingomonas sp. TaxID=28214 RepID=UPI0031DB8F96